MYTPCMMNGALLCKHICKMLFPLEFVGFFPSYITVIITIITWYEGFLKRKQVTVKIIMTVTLRAVCFIVYSVFGFLETGSHLCSSV